MPASTTVVEPRLAPPATGRSELRKIIVAVAAFLSIQAVIWLLFFFLHHALPYTVPGHEIIYRAKVEAIAATPSFPADAQHRVVIFGNSRVLCGFKPDLFDSLLGDGTASYNMGLPDSIEFIEQLEIMARRGPAPTHVLLTAGWPAGPRPQSIFKPVRSDLSAIYTLFPFRMIIRDLTQFALRARDNGGLVNFYNQGQQIVHDMLRDRGFYFIKEQASSEDLRLPDDFVHDRDKPDEIKPRTLLMDSPHFARFYAIVDKYDMQVYFVPSYCREHEQAAPPALNFQTLEAIKAYPRLHLLGPDYFRYPNRLFADWLHLNPAGADVYTRTIADMVRPFVVTEQQQTP